MALMSIKVVNESLLAGSNPEQLASGTSPPARATISPASPVIAASAQSERDEIQRRVTVFRNQQLKVKLQREAYYNAALARARSGLHGHSG
jgi:hypothetical protein